MSVRITVRLKLMLGGELRVTSPALILDLLQLDDGVFMGEALARVAERLLVVEAGLLARVDHLTLAADVAHIHHGLASTGVVCGRHKSLQVGHVLAVLSIACGHTAFILELVLNTFYCLLRNL